MNNLKIIIFIILFLFNKILICQEISIKNTNFEDTSHLEAMSPNLGEIKHWKPIDNSGYSYDLDAENPYEGKYALKITHHSGNKAAIRQSIFINPERTQKYTLSVAIRTQALIGKAGAYINVWEGDELIFFEDMSSQQIDSTRDWQIYNTTVLITPKTTKLVLGYRMEGEGIAWFDKLTLKPYESTQTQTDFAQKYLDTAISIIKKRALYRDSVDWKYIDDCLSVFSEGVQNQTNCYPILRFVLSQLHDGHSSLTEPKAQEAWLEEKTEEEKYKIPFAEGHILDKNVGYIQMKRFSSGNEKEKIAYADSLHRLIKQLDKTVILRGWVVDLRDNTGGNCWPMLAGIGPILGDGVAGYFVSYPSDGLGYLYESWEYKQGYSIFNSFTKKVKATKPYRVRKNLPIAVLIGGETASSGEVIVASFKNHPNARLFGEPTGGYSTANEIYTLSDNATIELTTAIYADRKKVHYGKKIDPDIIVENPDNIRELDLDPVVKAALKWLLK